MESWLKMKHPEEEETSPNRNNKIPSKGYQKNSAYI